MSGTIKHNGTNTMERVTGDMSNAQAQRVTAKPNIVFILADDMRKDDMEFMPKTHSLLREQGMGFRNAFVSNPLCAPSRSSIMRGQYSHNTHRCLVQLLHRQPLHHHRRLASLPGQWKRKRQRGHALARRWLQDCTLRQVPKWLHGHHPHPPRMG